MSEVIAIRVDGNSEIGFGHLMRTQALARQIEKRGAKVIFLSRNPENIRGYQVEIIGSGNELGEEDAMVEHIIKSCGADMLIIDSYAYEQSRLDKMAELNLFSVYIDDMNRYEFNVDFVVNGNLYASKLDYRGRTECLLGSKYLLMREEFCGLPPRKIRSKVEDVLISFGAADIENITLGLLQCLFSYKNFPGLNWHVVIGPVFRSIEEIEFLVHDRVNIFLHHSPDIKELMEKCDISINAAGSTTYELAACGVPALLMIAADNQVKLAHEAELQGFAVNLGWYNDLQPPIFFKALDGLIDDYNMRHKMTRKGQTLIDGAGTGRVADILLEVVRRRHERNDTGQEDISNRRNRDRRQSSGLENAGI